MDPAIPLIVPEINRYLLDDRHLLIANPNCSTIQMVMALAPLHKKYQVKRIVVSTYQSVSGSGNGAVKQMEGERLSKDVEKAYPHEIDLNLIPEAGTFTENGYTTEEIKLENETRKIIGDDSISVTATAVRVPVLGGHSEAVNIEFVQPFQITEIRELLGAFPGVTVIDDPENHQYPMPMHARGKNDVFVGRIRRDHSIPNGLNLWIVSDNLRKGAATNAVQIAIALIQKDLVKSESL
jgi:aspartate-semialdehyde dehydrogenase